MGNELTGGCRCDTGSIGAGARTRRPDPDLVGGGIATMLLSVAVLLTGTLSFAAVTDDLLPFAAGALGFGVALVSAGVLLPRRARP